MAWVIGVGYKEDVKDPLGINTKRDIEDLRISNVKDVKTLQTYVLEGDLTKEEVEKACKELFVDRVTQYFNFSTFREDGSHVKDIVNFRKVWVVEVMFKPGVMDAVGISSERALKTIGIRNVSVKTGTTFVISGELSKEQLEMISRKCLANGLIQNFRKQWVD
jgi:phosphoribosylformylglycinamidine (FGAM) synthase PurS component